MTTRNTSALLSIFLLVSLILSSCNLPTKPSEQAEVPPDILATTVALTLTAAPTKVSELTTESTPSAIPTSTTVPTQTVTLTPTVIHTGTVTPTPLSDDPAVKLGNPTGKDDLNTGKGFGLTSPYEDDYTKFSVSDGAMVLANTATNGWKGWRVRPPKLTNFYLEATLIIDSCQGKDIIGIVFRAPDYTSGAGYYYGISCDGRFIVSRWDSGSTTATLVNLTATDKVHPGIGQTNKLGVWATGSHFSLYMNGKLIQEFEDSTYSEGYYGPYTSGTSGVLTSRLDSIAYWIQP